MAIRGASLDPYRMERFSLSAIYVLAQRRSPRGLDNFSLQAATHLNSLPKGARIR